MILQKDIKPEIKKMGLVQASEVTAYCLLVGLLMWKGNKIFGNTPNYFGPVAVLLLLSVSVLICAKLVFYKPYKLFFDNKKKDAADLVISTTMWLTFYFLAFLFIAAVS